MFFPTSIYFWSTVLVHSCEIGSVFDELLVIAIRDHLADPLADVIREMKKA